MELEIGTLIIRAINLGLWLVVAFRISRGGIPVSNLARRIIITMIVFGMSVFLIGALVPFGFPGTWASLLYTAFTAYAAIIALALLTTGEPNGHSPADGDVALVGDGDPGRVVDVDDVVAPAGAPTLDTSETIE